MFGPLFERHPFHHLHLPPAFSHANYNVADPSRIPLPTRLSRGRHTQYTAPHIHHNHEDHEHQHRLRHGHAFYSNLSPSSSSDPDSTEDSSDSDTYHHTSPDTDSSSRLASSSSQAEEYLRARPPHHRKEDRLGGDNKYDNDHHHHHHKNLIAPFHRTTLTLAHQTFANLPVTHTSSSVLILPYDMTPLHVRISTPSATHTLHATVAGDMRFHEVVRQLVQAVLCSEVKAYVRLRGEWQEPKSGYRMSDVVEQGGRYVVNDRGEVEIRIDVRGGTRSGRTRGFRTWEREMGRAWEIRE